MACEIGVPEQRAHPVAEPFVSRELKGKILREAIREVIVHVALHLDLRL